MEHSEPQDPDPKVFGNDGSVSVLYLSYLFAWCRPPDQLTAMSQAWVLSSVAACIVAPVYLRQQRAGLQSGTASL
jgi:hypothetical protein